MSTRRATRRERVPTPVKQHGAADPSSGKRAASEAAAKVTKEQIAELFGLSLQEAANRIGVRRRTAPSFRSARGGRGREASGGLALGRDGCARGKARGPACAARGENEGEAKSGAFSD